MRGVVYLMKKNKIIFACFIVSLWISGVFSQGVQAQSPVLADIREQVNGVFVQLQTFDNLCVVILSAQLKEVDTDILEIRKLITVNKGNLTQLIESFTLSDLAGMQRVVDTIKELREVKELLRASNFGGRAANQPSAPVEIMTCIYALNGQLIATQLHGLTLNTLANGVYIVTSEIAGAAPRLSKIIVRH
jgi:hypothetical protein